MWQTIGMVIVVIAVIWFVLTKIVKPLLKAWIAMFIGFALGLWACKFICSGCFTLGW